MERENAHERLTVTYRKEVDATESRTQILYFRQYALVVFPFIFASSLSVLFESTDTKAWVVRMSLDTTPSKKMERKRNAKIGQFKAARCESEFEKWVSL